VRRLPDAVRGLYRVPFLLTISPQSNDLLDRIRYLAQFRQRPVTLKQLLELGSNPSEEALLVAAQFLHQELPVRLAHRVIELESLPFGLAEMPSIRLLRDMYIDSTRELMEFPRPELPSDDMSYVQTIDGIKRRHSSVVPLMATGVLELKRLIGADALSPKIQEFLDRFFMSRIGIRMLIGQHVALHQPPSPGFAGLICAECSPAAVARDAMADARHLCELRYGVAPEVGVFGKSDLVFPYLPSHLHHMLFELLKNSMRAVVELHDTDAAPLPMVRVALAEGQEDVTIKISDEGGGIPRSGIPQIWTYLYTTAEPPEFDSDCSSRSDFRAPLAGLGYGLPLSRLYARYFGGDLQIISMEGYGTDAYLHLKRLGDAREVLPRKLH
jgi:pyruvate dehydrogenase kinase 2/3/4